MAIIQCPECRTDVSDKAPACPKCGFPVASHAAENVERPEQQQAPAQPKEAPKKANLLGIFGFSISCLSVLFILSTYLFFLLSLLGMCLSVAGWTRAAKKNMGSGLALAGFIIGLVFLVLSQFMSA